MKRLDFAPPPRPPKGESIVPMINVVFLLLIFFLMTAQIAPPEPFDLSPPAAASETPAEAEMTVYLGPEGELGFQDAQGEEAVFHALERTRIELCADGGCAGSEAMPLRVKADETVPALTLARLLPRLAEIGFSDVELVTEAQ
ncbi:ExbD/TolR family protein [Celeribacter indicus]|uniref:Biopolymer transport protein n=1 Tax=Celeribacter indicus TaxID=1208324 RepID=A0A0B5DYF4_9RHOB|nr:biopolymer transporter ExbD [Celeribacter indicus]AJE45227.1 biopolymer transport protein [Celeribacter indicus]SDX45731.1 outer membrane transport energization protein ExbD [Celeribacter indicus]